MNGKPAPDVVAGIRYADAPAAIAWLERVLGLRRHLVVPGEGGRILHAELIHGNGVVMLGSSGAECGPIAGGDAGETRIGLYLVVDDPDAACARARAAGADVVVELHDTPYGSRQFAVRDPEGVVWTLGTHRPPTETRGEDEDAGRSARWARRMLRVVLGAVLGWLAGVVLWPLVAMFVFGEIEFHSGFWRESLRWAPWVGAAAGTVFGVLVRRSRRGRGRGSVRGRG